MRDLFKNISTTDYESRTKEFHKCPGIGTTRRDEMVAIILQEEVEKSGVPEFE